MKRFAPTCNFELWPSYCTKAKRNSCILSILDRSWSIYILISLAYPWHMVALVVAFDSITKWLVLAPHWSSYPVKTCYIWSAFQRAWPCWCQVMHQKPVIPKTSQKNTIIAYHCYVETCIWSRALWMCRSLGWFSTIKDRLQDLIDW